MLEIPICDWVLDSLNVYNAYYKKEKDAKLLLQFMRTCSPIYTPLSI